MKEIIILAACLVLGGCAASDITGEINCGDDAEPVVKLEMRCEKNPPSAPASGG